MAGYKNNSSSNVALAAAHFDQIYLCGKVQSHRIVSRFISFEALTCIQNARLAGWTPHLQRFTTPLWEIEALNSEPKAWLLSRAGNRPEHFRCYFAVEIEGTPCMRSHIPYILPLLFRLLSLLF